MVSPRLRRIALRLLSAAEAIVVYSLRAEVLVHDREAVLGRAVVRDHRRVAARGSRNSIRFVLHTAEQAKQGEGGSREASNKAGITRRVRMLTHTTRRGSGYLLLL